MLFFYNSSVILNFFYSQFTVLFVANVTELRVFDKSVYLSIININILANIYCNYLLLYR